MSFTKAINSGRIFNTRFSMLTKFNDKNENILAAFRGNTLAYATALPQSVSPKKTTCIGILPKRLSKLVKT